MFSDNPDNTSAHQTTKISQSPSNKHQHSQPLSSTPLSLPLPLSSPQKEESKSEKKTYLETNNSASEQPDLTKMKMKTMTNKAVTTMKTTVTKNEVTPAILSNWMKKKEVSPLLLLPQPFLAPHAPSASAIQYSPPLHSPNHSSLSFLSFVSHDGKHHKTKGDESSQLESKQLLKKIDSSPNKQPDFHKKLHAKATASSPTATSHFYSSKIHQNRNLHL
mmetsp:Transcript_6769/g.9062  ORF Transcript_6769/g.9062 Transcript_6769/m.9062 type:complete len:219 (+) Transcript_6769:906-1562(+)